MKLFCHKEILTKLKVKIGTTQNGKLHCTMEKEANSFKWCAHYVQPSRLLSSAYANILPSMVSKRHLLSEEVKMSTVS